MVSQAHPSTLKEKEQEKQKEKIMKLLLGFPLSTMCLNSQEQLSFEITTTTTENTLIPRVVDTNIIVFAMIADMRMSNRFRTDNMSHDIRVSARTPDMSLHKAASHGDLEGVREVIRNKRELLRFAEPQTGNLALHLAVLEGHKKVANYLVDAYPQGSYELNHLGYTSIYYVVQRKDLDLVEYMFNKLDKGDKHVFRSLDQGKSIVRVAITDNNQEMLRTILKYQPDLIKSTDEEGLTPLSLASSKGYVNIASYILQKYPKSIKKPNKDKERSYPIHKACLGGHVEILEMFYSKFPESLGYLDHHGQTILHLATKKRGNKLKNVVSYLLSLDEGRKLMKIKDENGNTPLDLAKHNRNGEVEEVINKIKAT